MDQRPRVMLVDDHGRLAGLFHDLLGDRVRVEARDGLTAVEALAAGAPDVILIDFNEPGAKGLEALRSLRSRRPDIPVIMVSEGTEVRLAEEAFEIGAFAYLPEPFQAHYAEHLIATALAQTRPR